MAMPVQFGTDGIRGRASDEITERPAPTGSGRAVASGLHGRRLRRLRHPRELAAHWPPRCLAGLRDGGAHGVNLGYFTTPGVAVIAQQRGGVGIVVSASHNPYYDNGLKVLGFGRRQARLRDRARGRRSRSTPRRVAPSDVFDDVRGRRIGRARLRASTCARSCPPISSSLHIVLDCANGAASHVAHELFESTGARITTIHDEPDGRNINERCGSTHVDDLVDARAELGADLGLAFDGDADRLIAVDAEGNVRDGDDLMILFALRLLRARRARRGTGRHLDEQPRPAPRDRRRRASTSSRPTWATATS